MLQVSGLEKHYGPQTLFENASFTVNPGERVGLVGRNGHGKTTLFRLILGIEQADSGFMKMPKDYTVGHLSQHLHFTEKTILDEACLALPMNDDGWQERYKAEQLLSGLGFSEADFERAPHEFSGGFQIRLNLVKVLLSEPNLLLLDEPTNYLDIVSVRWLIRFLQNWKNELIIITHDRDFMDSVTTHTMAIHRCQVRKIPGPTQKLYEMLAQEEEIYEQTRLNEEKKRKEEEKFINRFRAQATRARAVQSRVKRLAKKEVLEKLSDIASLEFQFQSAPFPGKWLMEAQDISFGFEHDEPLLISNLSLAVGKSDRIGIIGKNGKGKTTLLNLLAGELQPLAGRVQVNSNTLMSYFGQTNINRLNQKKTIEQEISSVNPDMHRTVVRSICGAMMFEGDTALKPISVLSGGERSRVLLGKLLVTPSNLLLLDEPTNHLDMDSIDSLVEALDAFPGGVLIVTHSEMILHSLATRLIVFDNGEVTLFEGTYQDFLDRVGWGGEDIGKVSRSNSSESKGNKKEKRRERAEQQKLLAPLKKRVQALESDIMSLEAREKELNDNIHSLSELGSTDPNDAKKISDWSFEVLDLHQKINTLFGKLEIASNELAAKEKELGFE